MGRQSGPVAACLRCAAPRLILHAMASLRVPRLQPADPRMPLGGTLHRASVPACPFLRPCRTAEVRRACRSYGKGVKLNPFSLVMCVRNPPTFAPSGLRRAWGLVENRAALLRTRQAGTRAPPALLRAAYLHSQMTATTHCKGNAQWVPRRPPGTQPTGLGVARRLGTRWGLSLCWRISDAHD
jgi:hypothetical protein